MNSQKRRIVTLFKEHLVYDDSCDFLSPTGIFKIKQSAQFLLEHGML